MAPPRLQYVRAQFGGSGKEYTYKNEGPRREVGDVVRVETRYGGWQKVTLTAVDVPQPEFRTKGIAFHKEDQPGYEAPDEEIS